MKRSLCFALFMAVTSVAFAQSDGMKDMPMHDMHGKSTDVVHHATGIVKQVDSAKGTVTLAHEPVKSLNWSAMTMTFNVKDKALFGKLISGKKVQVDFIQQGSNYVITAVK